MEWYRRMQTVNLMSIKIHERSVSSQKCLVEGFST